MPEEIQEDLSTSTEVGKEEIDANSKGGDETAKRESVSDEETKSEAEFWGEEVTSRLPDNTAEDAYEDEDDEQKRMLRPSPYNGCNVEDIKIQCLNNNSDTNSFKSLKHVPDQRCCGESFSPFIRQITNVVVACFAGLVNGTIHAYPAVALPRWEEMGFVLTTAQVTWFASTPMIVCVVLCWGAGILVETFGNRRSLMFMAPFMAASWIIIAMATDFWALILGRILQGIVASVYMVIITVYPAEVSAVRWRGIMTGISEGMVILGAFLTYVVGLVLQPSSMGITMAVSLVPMFASFYFMKESPLWTARQGREEETVAILKSLRGQTDITLELEQIKASVETEKMHKPSSTEQLLLLRKRIYFKPLMLAVLVLLFKELTGQYAAMAYTVQIFKMAGSSLDPYWCAVVMGAARFLPCLISWFLIERLSRRLLIGFCMTLASFSLASLGAVLWFSSKKDGGLPPSLGWIPLACFLVFTVAYGSGIGPTSWTLVAELLPSQVRNVGAGIITTSFSLFLVLVGLTFPFMVESMGIALVFITYSVCALTGVIFIIFGLPETRGRSFSEIQNVLAHKKSDDCSTA